MSDETTVLDLTLETTPPQGSDVVYIIRGTGAGRDRHMTYLNFMRNFVTTQADFNSVIVRVAANQYKIADNIKFLRLDALSGGYTFSDVLSGGDTWGYLQTNNCTHLEFVNGAYIDMENTQGYIEVNTDACLMRNVDIRGANSVASAIAQSFLLNASYVTFDNCKTSNRLSNAIFFAFRGSGTALHNKTSKYTNCSAYNLTSSNQMFGFVYCWNNVNPLIYNIESTTNNVGGVANSFNVINNMILELDASGIAYGIVNVENSSCIYIEDIDSSANESKGISACNQISNAYIYDIQSSVNQDVYGLDSCDNISSIKIQQLDTSGTGDVYGLSGCNQASSIEIIDLDGADAVYGVYQSDQLSSIKIEDLDSSGGIVRGIYDSDQISSSYVYDLLSPANSDIYGMDTVNNVSACKIQQLDTSGTGIVYGIRDSFQIAAGEIVDLDGASTVYGIEDTDQIAGVKIEDIESSGGDAFGAVICEVVSSLFVNTVDYSGVGAFNAVGLSTSKYISSIRVSDIDIGGGGTVEGINGCQYGSSLFTDEAVNSSNNFIDTADGGAVIATDFSCNDNWT